MASKFIDLAERMSNWNALAGGDIRETFKLPVEAARAKAREIISQAPQGSQLTIIERWQQLPDGRIELTLRLMQA